MWITEPVEPLSAKAFKRIMAGLFLYFFIHEVLYDVKNQGFLHI